MSKRKIRNYENSFKAKIVLEVLKGEKTVNEISQEYQVLPCTIKGWKRQFLENMEFVFNKDNAVVEYKTQIKDKEAAMDELYKQIGKLNTLLEWAKKKSREAGFEL